MEEFRRLTRLPAYVFNITGELKAAARKRGEDIIDFGMGNPDGATPKHIVDKLIEAAQKTATHRYSLSRGLPRLRKAICNWYSRRYHVDLDPETEAIVTIGSKEGIAHLCLAMLGEEDTVAVPNPSYPIHIFGPVIAGSRVQSIAFDQTNDAGLPITSDELIVKLEYELPRMEPRPKLLILNFPANPTAQCVDLSFFERLVPLCRELGIYLVHDLAYADLVFDGYRAPSVLEVPGAKEIAVEFFTLSKSYNMPGWRVGFMVGNKKLVAALGRIKSYFDYGTFTPIQVASIAALEGPQECVTEIVANYKARRDVLVPGLNKLGWHVDLPKATMFAWARIPEQYRAMGSVEFSKKLLLEAKVAVSPGIGFGEHGDGHVRFSLIENEERTRQALRGIKQMFKNG
jgi:alanine-synthesizing transaminase